MTLHISDQPFTHTGPDQWCGGLGPAWVELRDGRTTYDTDVCPGLRRFVAAAVAMAPGDVAYGTVYGAVLDGRPVPAGDWHVDTGEPDLAVDRYVSTWTSDGAEIGNVFLVNGTEVPAANLRIARFNEGADNHRRPPQPARPGAWGVFMSLSLYRDDEPANIGCPRLIGLSGRAHIRSWQAAGRERTWRELCSTVTHG